MSAQPEPVAALRRFWFPPIPTARVALFRIAVASFALIDAAFFATYVRRYTEVDPLFASRIHIFRPAEFLLGDWRVDAATFLVLNLVLVVALVFSVVGYRTRISLLVAAVLYLHHFALFNSFGKVNHGKITIILALFVLSIAPAGRSLSLDSLRRRAAGEDGGVAQGSVLDPLAGWALRIVTVFIVLAYLISAYAKLTNTGLTWALEPILARSLLENLGPLQLWLIDNPWLLQIMQAVTLLIEVGAILLLFVGGRTRNFILAALASFHIGSYILLLTEFFGWVVTYLAFFRLERVLERPRSGLGRGSTVPRYEVRAAGASSQRCAMALLASAPPGALRHDAARTCGGSRLTAWQTVRALPTTAGAIIGGWLPGQPNVARAIGRGELLVGELPPTDEPQAPPKAIGDPIDAR